MAPRLGIRRKRCSCRGRDDHDHCRRMTATSRSHTLPDREQKSEVTLPSRTSRDGVDAVWEGEKKAAKIAVCQPAAVGL